VGASGGIERDGRETEGTFAGVGRGLFRLASHPVNLPDNEKDHKSDDQEIDYGAQKNAVVDRRRTGVLCRL